MSEPAPEPQAQGQGGFMSRKFLGIPAIFWLLGAAILAYLYFRNKSASSSGTGATSTGGSGQSTTGDITFQPAAETIDVQGQYGPNTQTGTDTTQSGGQNTSSGTGGTTTVSNNPPPSNGTPNPQPTPQPKPPTKTNSTPMKTHTVTKGQTLAQIAKQYGISADCLADANVYVAGEVPGNKKVGQTLGTGAGLKTGQVLKIPLPSQCSKS